MTRRIAAAILLTVWAILVAGGFAAYWAVRSVLLADLDRSLVDSARSLPQVAGGRDQSLPPPTAGPEDRYVIKNAIGQRVGSPADKGKSSSAESRPPYVAAFAPLGGGRRLRTVSVRLTSAGGVVPADGGAGAGPTARLEAGTPVIIVYSRPTDEFDRVLDRLAFTLALCGLAAGAAAAAVAVAVAKHTLRPLNAAAEVVGVIDEQKLDRRIDQASLPPELQPVAARLNGMLARLQHAFAQRKQFLADASHELRTPVAALVTTLEVALGRKRDAAELTRTIERCLSDARYLRRLVTTLLAQSRGDASAATPAAEGFDAAGLLDECAAVADALAPAHGVRVLRSYSRPMPVRTDPDRVRGIVTNLLANAVEHNRAGGTVELSAALAGAALELSVRDSGPGIAAEHLPHLFEPFYRADAARRWGENANLGLGLYIVQSHLQALGGRCKVESEVGVGTMMHVTLPGVAAPAQRAVATALGTERVPATTTVSAGSSAVSTHVGAQAAVAHAGPGSNVLPAAGVWEGEGSRR